MEKGRILIVDDDPLVRDVLSAIFSHTGNYLTESAAGRRDHRQLHHGHAVNAMREGAKDFITKPFNVMTVTSVADRIIGEKRLLGKLDAGGGYESSIGRLNAELFRKQGDGTAFTVEELRRCSNTQFDEAVVRAFLQTPKERDDDHGH